MLRSITSNKSNKGSPLHTAILSDCFASVASLSKDRDLLRTTDSFGLTPLELARYLHKTKMVEILSGNLRPRYFCSQPNVEFDEEITGLEFLSHPVFESAEALNEVFLWTAKEKEGMSPRRIWLGVHHDREIAESLHPRLIVRRIDKEIGLGVFAAERIAPQTFLGEYTGLIRQKRRAHDGESVYSFSYTAWRVGKNPYVISSEYMGNFTRFINHSDNPSAEAVCVLWRGMPRIIFLSQCEIAKGGQIHFDYGNIFWEQVPHIQKRPL